MDGQPSKPPSFHRCQFCQTELASGHTNLIKAAATRLISRTDDIKQANGI